MNNRRIGDDSRGWMKGEKRERKEKREGVKDGEREGREPHTDSFAKWRSVYLSVFCPLITSQCNA